MLLRFIMHTVITRQTARLALSTALTCLVVLLTGSMVAAQNGDVEAGKIVYAKNCRSCHGANGEGNPNMAKKLKVAIKDLRLPEVRKATDADWRKDIVKGVGKMDPTEDVSDQDVTNVIAFMRAMAPKSTP